MDLLLSSRHLHAISCLPALCNICCIFLKHLLIESDTAEAKVPITEEEGCETQRKTPETSMKERSDGSEDMATDRMNDGAQLHPTTIQIPPTLTQVYLTFLDAFLSNEPSKGGRSDKTKNTESAQRYRTIRALILLIM